MKPLLAKEVRLLRPALVAAILLAVAPMWMTSWIFGAVNLNVCGFALCGGLLMLSLTSFGREFELRTFSMQLAQPVTRRRIFWTKSAVLAVAMIMVYSVSFISWIAWCWWASLMLGGMRVVGQFSLTGGFEDILAGPGTWLMFVGGLGSLFLVPVIAFAGGLWATLLLRQIAAAFWFAVLIPGFILLEVLNHDGSGFVAYLVLGLYSAAGFWWAWHQFQRAQEVAWTGGTISLSGWRWFRPGADSTIRARQPLTALLRKEVQLYQVAIIAMGGLFIVHLGAVYLRKRLRYTEGNAALFSLLELFAGIWFAVPLMAGGLGVADERQLGTLDNQFSLPVSKRVQFALKFVFALFVTGVMGAVLPWLAEAIGNSIGGGGGLGGIKIAFPGEGLPNLLSMFLAAALVSFYASTLSRNVLQAIGVAVATGIVIGFIGFFWAIFPMVLGTLGLPVWGDLLVRVLGWPTVAATLVWLGYGNFRGRAAAGNLWFHNLLRLAVVVVGISLAAIALYNRAWELLLPLEPAHGPARLTVGAPRLHSMWFHTSVLLPDGKLWEDVDFFDYRGRQRKSDGGHFIDGTNWISERRSYLEDAAIRADGTLWVSEKPINPYGLANFDTGVTHFARPGSRMIQYGSDTNWLTVVGFSQNLPVILLKTDGTLWRWGSLEWHDRNWPGLPYFQPVRLGTESNWATLFRTSWGTCVMDRNGLAWKLISPKDHRAGFSSFGSRRTLVFKPREAIGQLDSETELERWNGLDHTKWKYLSDSSPIGVREDGTLWAGGHTSIDQSVLSSPMSRIGTDTDWVSAATGRDGLVALKADGSLWIWKLPMEGAFNAGLGPAAWNLMDRPPVRLGKNSDWVAIGGNIGSILALAADGSLWSWWPDAAQVDQDVFKLLKSSRHPVKVASIFGEH